jgi:hypothetical protein
MTKVRLDKIAPIEDLVVRVARRRIPKITLGSLESGGDIFASKIG